MNKKQIRLLIDIYDTVKQKNNNKLAVNFSQEMLNDMRVLQSEGIIRITGMQPNISFEFLANGIEVAERYKNL